MQLFIRSGDLYTEIPSVTLKDGYIPVVGDRKNVNPDPDTAVHIEPAIWFKVLALDSVSIDCTKRAIMWNSDSAVPTDGTGGKRGSKSSRLTDSFRDSESDSPLQKRKRISQSMYIGGEFYGFESELDELFDTMQAALAEFAETSLNTEDFYETVMRLLHCHVLPAITMTEEDSQRLEHVLGQQESHIQIIDDHIIQKNTQIEEIQRALRRQRLRYIDELSRNDPPSADYYKGLFASQIKSDIEQDIDSSSERLEELQKAVETAKVMSMCTSSSPHSQEVELKRQERNIGFTEHQKLLHARENLRELMTETSERRMSLTESIRHSFRSKKGRILTNPLQDIYLEMHQKIKYIKDDIMQLMDKKVMMISVKEAVRNTLEEIRESSESQGVDTDRRGGTRATHVLRQSRIPREWLTMTEQVAVVLADKENEITKKHITFMERVMSQCSAAIFEKHLLNLSDNKKDDTEEPAEEEQNSTVSRNKESSSKEPRSNSIFYDNTDDIELGNVNAFDDQSCPLTKDEQLAFQLHKDLNRNSLISLEGEIGSEDIVIVHDTEQDHLKRLLDTLKVDIHGHFEDVVQLFQTELKLSNPTSYKKLWLCYEAHFYDAVMENVVNVYEYAYSHVGNKLTQCIPELGANDLNLEDTIVAGLLESTYRKSLQHVQFTEYRPPLESEEDAIQGASPQTVTAENGTTPDTSDDSFLSTQSQPDADYEEYITEKEELLRQLSAPQPETDAPLDHSIKRVTIHYPSSVTMIYNRRTWPLPTIQSLTGEFECGMDALALDKDDSVSVSDDELEQTATLRSNSGGSPKSPSSGMSPGKKMRIRIRYRHRFAPALHSIREALQESVPLVKLQHLTRCLREIVQSISNLQTEEFQMPMGVCCDNLLDMLVVLICNCNLQTVAQLHAHVMMLTDLMPPCLMNGPYEYSLLQFFGAFQVIQERVVVKSRNQAFPQSNDQG